MSYCDKPIENRANCWFWGFLICHILVWTVVPAVTHLNLPLDSMEGTTWGHQLELGYDRNPFLNAWLTALVVWISHHTDWAIYLTGILCTAICFWAVFQLGRKFLNPWHALIAVLLLEGMQYFNLTAMDLNDNVLEIALWPLMAWSFYNATQRQRWRDWLLVGLWSGLATMAKYYVAVILLPMFVFLLINPIARKSFSQVAFYAAILFYLAIIAPHFIWLYQHQGVAISYAFAKTAIDPHVNAHIHYAAHFTLNYLGACIIPLALFGLFYLGKNGPSITTKQTISSFDKQFIWFIGFGPFIVTVLLSMVIGWTLHTGWGAPLPALWGVALLAFTQPVITLARFYRFIVVLVSLMALVIGVYTYSKVNAGNTSSANYPGRHMAQALTAEWHQRYHTPLFYVAGLRWHAGNIAYYSPEQPAVYIEWNQVISPWIDEQDMMKKGAIFIWPEEFKVDVSQLKQRFPKLQKVELRHFAWQRDKQGKVPPLAVWVSFLPPADAI